MNPRTRAFLGAASGALFVLLAHPATRPGLTAAFRPLPRGGLTELLARPRLAKPTSAATGALYLHAGAQRLAYGPPLAPPERDTLLQIAAEGERKERDNAFWPMAAFVFRGRGAEARDAWKRASQRRVYNDHQGAALVEDRDRIAAKVGDVQAWIYAAIAPRRSQALARMCLKSAEGNLRNLSDPATRAEFAYESIRNGAVLRDGSRRLSIGMIGIALIEGATFRPEMTPRSNMESPTKRLWVAKTEFTERLRRSGRTAEAAFCDRQFRINDSWQAFMDVETPDSRFQAMAIAATIIGALPGALLAAAFAGAGILLFSRRVAAVAHVQNRFRGPGLTALCLIMLGLGAVTGYPAIGIAAGACSLMAALGPERPKRLGNDSLGPFHDFTVGLLVLSLLVLIAMIAIDRTMSGTVLSAQGATGAWLGDRQRLSAIAVVLLGASALVAPAWALARRFSTPAVASITYGRLGRGMVVTGLTLAIVSSPLSLAVDRWLGDHLAKIALNEQVYYNPNEVEQP